VQQGLRRDASAIDADAAGVHFGIGRAPSWPEISGQKRRGVPARAAPDDDNWTSIMNYRHEDTKTQSRHE